MIAAASRVMPIDAATDACESPKTNGIAGRTEPISVATAITRAFRMLRAPSERYCPAPIPTVAATAIPIAAARILGAVALVARRPATTPRVEVIPSNDPKMASRRSVPSELVAGEELALVLVGLTGSALTPITVASVLARVSIPGYDGDAPTV